MLIEIGTALILAKIIGYALEKIKQPGVIGEILAGIIIGPFIAGRLFEINYISPETEGIAQLGIIILLFISGLEIGVEEIKAVGKNGMITSLFDVSIAFLFGCIAGYILGYDIKTSIAIGNIMVATSVGITVKTLMEMKALHTKVGELILTVAVLDDVLGIIVLSITLGQGQPMILLLKVMAFFLLFVIGLLFVNKIKDVKIRIPRLMLTLSLAFALIFSAFAKSLGLAAITGSFFAGLIFSVLPQRRRITEFCRQIGEIFFIPLFFVWVGASFDFYALKDIGLLVLLFVPMALIGKVVGCSLGARVNKFKGRDALAVGVGMMPRMEVALVVVTAEISMGIFSETLAHQILAATIVLVIISSILTPILLKIVYKGEKG